MSEFEQSEKPEAVKQRPYVFTFWDSSGPMPEYIRLCIETQKKNLPPHYEHVHLNFESCIDWVPERDWLWKWSFPAAEGRSQSQEGRRWALFSDMLRIALIRRHGGVWIDIDTLIFPHFTRLRKLHREHEIIVAEGADGQLANGLISARRKSPFMNALWLAMREGLAEKKRRNEQTLGWGELGFRLLKKQWLYQEAGNGFILPYGMYLNFDHSEESPLFAEASFAASELHVNAIGISVLNNSLAQDIRQMNTEDLTRANTMFARGFRYAMGESGRYQKYLMPLTAEQMISINRDAPVRQSLALMQKKNEHLDRQREKLRERNAELENLRKRARRAEARLQAD